MTIQATSKNILPSPTLHSAERDRLAQGSIALWRPFCSLRRVHICKRVITLLLASTYSACLFAADRINHEGRILGPEPVVTAPILFNTPEADAIVSALQIFPRDSAWNEDISRRTLLPNSDAMIAQIIADLRSDRRMLRAFHE